MSRRSTPVTKRGSLTALLIFALILCAAPVSLAIGGDGHIGGKPEIGQGDGIPQTKPGTIRAGELKHDGSGIQGTNPASDGGDGIPNGGPIEVGSHQSRGSLASVPLAALTSILLLL